MSLASRQDIRSDELFDLNIGDFTGREAVWGEIIRVDYTSKGRPCRVEEHGVDNTGKVIKGKLPNNNVDKKYIFADGTEELTEIKTNPQGNVGFGKDWHFKAWALKSCIKQNANVVVPTRFFYITFGKDAIKKLYSMPHRIYPKFSPNDLAVQIKYDVLMHHWISIDLITKTEWSEDAQKLVNKHWNNILGKDKDK